MGGAYLIDTNVIVEFAGNLLPEKACSFVSKVVDERFNISVINKIEVLGHASAGKALEDFVGLSIVFDLNEDVVSKTIELRKIYKIKLPDAVIAATSLVNNLILVTRNVKDFNKIKDLKVIDPYEV
jgi:predicted nucleic acid-binding protein